MEDIIKTNELYAVSKHCKERYAERILNKSNNNEIQKFIIENENKIITDISKLIKYGKVIYSGKQTQKDIKNNNVIDVYLKDAWVVLVDSKFRNVITLYKIDLGCDEEFNLQYINKMVDKLNESKENLARVTEEVNNETATYRDLIKDSTTQISEYRTMIKNLEKLCEGYQTIIDNNDVKIAQANMEVVNIVNKLIGKKEF